MGGSASIRFPDGGGGGSSSAVWHCANCGALIISGFPHKCIYDLIIDINQRLDRIEKILDKLIEDKQ